MHAHHRTVCRVCELVMNTCRCASKDKETRYDICTPCAKKVAMQALDSNIAEQVETARREGGRKGRCQAYEMAARLLRQSARNVQRTCPTHDATIALLHELADEIAGLCGKAQQQ